jgi:predicted negative regulator of RcsB-dependent stress response
MITLGLILVIVVLLVAALAFSHYKLIGKIRDKNSRLASILYEDVMLRLQEVEEQNNPIEALRKVREAHSSLETLAAVVGGFSVLSEAVEIDVDKLDENIAERERVIRQQLQRK